jgi:nitroreductase
MMTIQEAMQARHAVRQYTDKPIPAEAVEALQEEIRRGNEEGKLHMQLVLNDPSAFAGGLFHYGSFKGVNNYIGLVGPDDANLEEKCGYYGERVVLLAQQLGLNTCWVAMTFSKGAAKKKLDIQPGEKLCVVISIGYGVTQGTPHKSKEMKDLCVASSDMPEWFKKGMEAAMLAPTAVNQQKFRFWYSDENTINAEATGGFYSKVDLGIVKYHFEAGSGKKVIKPW